MSERSVLCHLSEENGISSSHAKMISKHFTIVNAKDFEQNPVKYAENIVAIIQKFKKPKITQELLRNLRNLKIIALTSVGYNHIDVKMIHSFGVKVSHTPRIVDDSVADLGILLLLAAGRDLRNAMAIAKSPEIMSTSRNVEAMDIHSSTLGIVGMGRIGYSVATRAKAFNMKVLYYNRNRRSVADEEAVGAIYYENLSDMLPLCDYVMMVVCLTPETTKMFGAAHFKLMKSSSVFINISRGETVDQEALVEALKTGEIRSAALDVTTPEPLPKDHVLLKLPNVIIIPHKGTATINARRKMVQMAIDNVLAALEGRPLLSVVSP